MSYNDQENLNLLWSTTGGLPYKSPSYTCVKEFTDSFPQKAAEQFEQEYFPATESAWQPEAPYPRIYTKGYKTTILTKLR